LLIRKAKGDKRRNAADKPIMTMPITVNPALVDLMEKHCTQRVIYCAKFFSTSQLAALWSFAPYENSANWQVAATLYAWLLDPYTAIGAAPPKGFKSHSLRKGASSVASCIGTPLHVVKYMGGWANNSSVIKGKCIDPTMTLAPTAWRYFVWLVQAKPLH
jgi:hypothetical protein